MNFRNFAKHVLAATGTLCAVGIAGAQAATVNCGAGQTISAAIAALKPAIGYQTINVSGACTENVYVPPGLALSLVAAAGASLTPATSGTSTIAVQGQLSVTGLAITTSSVAGVVVYTGGYAAVVAGTITGPGDGIIVQSNSGAAVQNETINVTGYNAIANGATLEVDGVAPIGGATGTTLTSAGDGIACNQGNVLLNAYGGPISITNNGGNGVDNEGCNFHASASNGQIISIGNNKGQGFSTGQASSVTLANVQITGNGNGAIYAQTNVAVLLSGATITGNAGVALQANQNAVYEFSNATGINTISAPQGNTNVLFGCYQGGKQYAYAINGFITPPPTKSNKGCLTVGGK